MKPSFAPPTALGVYLPHPESSLCTQLTRGSAIVGLSEGSGTIRIFYEGNLIGAENLVRCRARAIHAANRLLHNYPVGYPTIAKAEVDPREVIEIGTLRPATGRLENPTRTRGQGWSSPGYRRGG